jgi:hypothetical protein
MCIVCFRAVVAKCGWPVRMVTTYIVVPCKCCFAFVWQARPTRVVGLLLEATHVECLIDVEVLGWSPAQCTR